MYVSPTYYPNPGTGLATEGVPTEARKKNHSLLIFYLCPFRKECLTASSLWSNAKSHHPNGKLGSVRFSSQSLRAVQGDESERYEAVFWEVRLAFAVRDDERRCGLSNWNRVAFASHARGLQTQCRTTLGHRPRLSLRLYPIRVRHLLHKSGCQRHGKL